MDEIADHATAGVEMRAHSYASPSAIRPEILEVLRQAAWRDDSDRKRQNYQDAFDRLIGLLGRSPKMAIVSWCIASNVALLIGDHDPSGWRWGLKNTRRSVPRKSCSRVRGIRGPLLQSCSQTFADCNADGGLPPFRRQRACRQSRPSIRSPARPRARAADPRSEWHATARLFASCIEAHFRTF